MTGLAALVILAPVGQKTIGSTCAALHLLTDVSLGVRRGEVGRHQEPFDSLVSHDPQVVEGMADRGITLHEGLVAGGAERR